MKPSKGRSMSPLITLPVNNSKVMYRQPCHSFKKFLSDIKADTNFYVFSGKHTPESTNELEIYRFVNRPNGKHLVVVWDNAHFTTHFKKSLEKEILESSSKELLPTIIYVKSSLEYQKNWVYELNEQITQKATMHVSLTISFLTNYFETMHETDAKKRLEGGYIAFKERVAQLVELYNKCELVYYFVPSVPVLTLEQALKSGMQNDAFSIYTNQFNMISMEAHCALLALEDKTLTADELNAVLARHQKANTLTFRNNYLIQNKCIQHPNFDPNSLLKYLSSNREAVLWVLKNKKAVDLNKLVEKKIALEMLQFLINYSTAIIY